MTPSDKPHSIFNLILNSLFMWILSRFTIFYNNKIISFTFSFIYSFIHSSFIQFYPWSSFFVSLLCAIQSHKRIGVMINMRITTVLSFAFVIWCWLLLSSSLASSSHRSALIVVGIIVFDVVFVVIIAFIIVVCWRGTYQTLNIFENNSDYYFKKRSFSLQHERKI